MKTFAMALAGLTLAAAAHAQDVTTVTTDIGDVLADAKGMTLYTFDKDSEGTSVCEGDCAVKWPPYLAEGADAAEEGLTVIARSDGSHQYAKDGKPLYYWIDDAKSGDVTGDGVGGVWHAARP